MNPAIIEALIKVGAMIGLMMTAAAYFVLLERRMAAWVQDRRGPNRVGIPLTKIRVWGLGQPLADGVKFIFKEEYTPGHVDKWLYVLAPLSILTAALAAFAVVPIGSVLPKEATTFLADKGVNVTGVESPIRLEVAPNLDVGMIYIFALSSIAVYGVVLGGWASNNKYSFLGGLRSSAQLIAYELPMGLGILGVVLAAHSLNLDAIITEQAKTGCWYAFAQPLGFIVFVIAAFAEAARLPFDLPGMRTRIGRRLSHGIRRTKTADVLGGRVPTYDHGVVLDCDPVYGWLAFLGDHRIERRSDVVSSDHADWGVERQNLWRDFVLYAYPLELAAFSLRSTDGVGLEDYVAVGDRQLCGDRDLGRNS